MPKMSEVFPSKYLAADDLRGQDHVVTIERYQVETMPSRDGPDEQKYILFFRGARKGLVLNKTNGQTIAHQHGDDLDGWIGKQVTIGATWVEAFGEQKFAIRVRPGLAPAAVVPTPRPNGNAPVATAAETPLGQSPTDPFTDESVAKDLNDDIPF